MYSFEQIVVETEVVVQVQVEVVVEVEFSECVKNILGQNQVYNQGLRFHQVKLISRLVEQEYEVKFVQYEDYQNIEELTELKIEWMVLYMNFDDMRQDSKFFVDFDKLDNFDELDCSWRDFVFDSRELCLEVAKNKQHLC